MSVQNFPSGFPEGVFVGGIPLMQAYPGRAFWVGNSATLPSGELTAANTNDGESNRPFATIAFAVSACAANRGDVIIVRPNFTETITAVAGLALSVAGIALVGLGAGSNRPTINFTTAVGASMTVTAANISMLNFLFTGGIDALTNPIHVQAADFSLMNCEYRDVTGQATDVILTTAAATRMMIKNYRHEGDTAAGTNTGIALVGTDGVVIDGFRMDGNFAIAAIQMRTTLSTDVEIKNGYVRNRVGATGILIRDTVTGSTGAIGPNLFYHAGFAGANNARDFVIAATARFFDPIATSNADNTKGLLITKSFSADA